MKRAKKSVLMVCVLLVMIMRESRGVGTVHKCVHATTKVSKAGDGTTLGSCIGCDPVTPDCYPGCQKLIDKVYLNCDSVCLPNGYYFDPQWELEGCWGNAIADIKVKVERCGCSIAWRSMTISVVAQFLVLFAGAYLLL